MVKLPSDQNLKEPKCDYPNATDISNYIPGANVGITSGMQECLTVMGLHKIGGKMEKNYCHHYGIVIITMVGQERDEPGKSNPCLG